MIKKLFAMKAQQLGKLHNRELNKKARTANK